MNVPGTSGVVAGPELHVCNRPQAQGPARSKLAALKVFSRIGLERSLRRGEVRARTIAGISGTNVGTPIAARRRNVMTYTLRPRTATSARLRLSAGLGSILLVFSAGAVHGQTLLTEKTWGGAGADIATEVARSADGSAYLVGTTDGFAVDQFGHPTPMSTPIGVASASDRLEEHPIARRSCRSRPTTRTLPRKVTGDHTCE